jgi:hypothetical protein
MDLQVAAETALFHGARKPIDYEHEYRCAEHEHDGIRPGVSISKELVQLPDPRQNALPPG